MPFGVVALTRALHALFPAGERFEVGLSMGSEIDGGTLRMTEVRDRAYQRQRVTFADPVLGERPRTVRIANAEPITFRPMPGVTRGWFLVNASGEVLVYETAWPDGRSANVGISFGVGDLAVEVDGDLTP